MSAEINEPPVRHEQKSFGQGHLERCRKLRLRQIDLAELIVPMRDAWNRAGKQRIAPELALIERKEFRDLAAAAIDRTLAKQPDGTLASACKINGNLLDFVSVVTPNIRLRARAGSGKSTALVIKADFLVKGLGVDPATIQMLTFNKAAAQHLETKLIERLGESGRQIKVRTFHALAWSILKADPATRKMNLEFKDEQPGAKDGYEPIKRAVTAELMAEDIRYFEALYNKSSHSWTTRNPDDFRSILCDSLTSAVALFRARLGGPVGFTENPTMAFLRRVLKRYEESQRQRNAIDGEDGLRKAAELLSEENLRLDSRTAFLFVDEFQDFSPAFALLTEALMKRNPACILNAVGDDWQSINSFMGSEQTYFKKFKTSFAPALNLPLQQNWRCGKSIVACGNLVMEADAKDAAVAALEHEGRLRIAKGEIKKSDRDAQRDFVLRNVETMASRAWADDLRAGRPVGKLVLIASLNKPYGEDPKLFLAALADIANGASAEFSTAHSSKGREWDHVILLDGIEGAYPRPHHGNLLVSAMLSKQDLEDEGQRLLYVAATRAKHSLAILAPTGLHPRLHGVAQLR